MYNAKEKENAMNIIREGKEIELTSEELAAAHAEFVTNFMRKTLEEDFDVATEYSQKLAEQAYDRYCEGNGETEYECIEAVYSESGEDEEKLICPATCQECFHCISFHGINEKYCEYIHEYLNDFSYCDHICSDMIYEVFVSGKSKGLWYVEGYDTDEELALAFCEEFGCASADKIRLECMAEE